MRYRSRTGDPVRIALLSGHVAVVTGEWRELPDQFRDAAYASGCISDDMEVNKEVTKAVEAGALETLSQDAELKSKVRSAIQKALDEDNYKAFTVKNGPTHKYLTDEVGEKVPSHIKDAVWGEFLEVEVPTKKKDTLTNDIT